MRAEMNPVFDLASIAVVISTIAGWLPAIASLLSIVWLCLRCYEAWLSIQDIKRKARNDDKGN